MPGLWIDLLGCLDLHSAAQAGADERSDAEDITTFDGASQQLQYHRVFGGQLLGQFIRAAQLTCPDKTVKSLHAVFAREGRAAEPVRYPSTRQHQGRSFASLTITAHQTRGVLASSSVSMHAVEDGPEHQDREPVPALLGEKHRAELDLIPWETRCADDLNAVTAGPPRLELWMRTPPVDGDLAFALTAYASDLTPIGTALRPSRVSTTAATARCSPPRSPLIPCGFTGLSAPTAGSCCGNTVQCWRTAAVLAAAMSSPRTARSSRRMRRRRCCAFATAANEAPHQRPHLVAAAQKRSHIAQNSQFRELHSHEVRMISSENESDVDTRRWLMTELPQILSAISYALAARGETL